MRKEILTLIATAMVLLGCTQDEIIQDQTSAGIPMTIQVSIGSPQTKTTYTYDSGAIKVAWEKGDQISVVSFEDDIAKTCDTFTASSQGKDVEFTGTYTGSSSPQVIKVFYPALTEEGTLYHTSRDLDDLVGWVSPVQEGMCPERTVFGLEKEGKNFGFNFWEINQFANNDASHLKAYDLMTATLDGISDLSSFALTKQTAVICLDIDISAIEDGTRLHNVDISTEPLKTFWFIEEGRGESVKGKYFMVGSTNMGYLRLGQWDDNFYGEGKGGFPGITKTSSDQRLRVYLPVMSGATLPKGEKVNISVLDGELFYVYYTEYTLPEDISIPMGSCVTISCKLDQKRLSEI